MNLSASGFKASKTDDRLSIVSTPSEVILRDDLENSATRSSILLVDERALDRECLAKAMLAYLLDHEFIAVGSIDEWNAVRDLHPPVGGILLNLGARRAGDASVVSEIQRLHDEFEGVPVVVLSDADDPPHVLQILGLGARGFIPSSVGVHVCVEALRLAVAGGTFVPASTLQALGEVKGEVSPFAGLFTPRQEAVVEALRKGKANKTIAYELDMCESTVKVHIRNIMKKLNATNRTQVAYKLNDLS